MPRCVSFRENGPLGWIRVHDLPDFEYFNHSVHLKKGVGARPVMGAPIGFR